LVDLVAQANDEAAPLHALQLLHRRGLHGLGTLAELVLCDSISFTLRAGRYAFSAPMPQHNRTMLDHAGVSPLLITHNDISCFYQPDDKCYYFLGIISEARRDWRTSQSWSGENGKL
jgi:hypothetical protein